MELLNTNLNTNQGSFIDTVFASELAKVRDIKLLEELEKPSIMRAAIYLRVSTKGQARKIRLPSLNRKNRQWNLL